MQNSEIGIQNAERETNATNQTNETNLRKDRF
jgi:hypothetical protein